LQEIYCAIEDRKAFHLNVHTPKTSNNNLSENANSFFLDLFSDIQIDIESKMSKINLSSILNKIK
jgi:hypothetical protein